MKLILSTLTLGILSCGRYDNVEVTPHESEVLLPSGVTIEKYQDEDVHCVIAEVPSQRKGIALSCRWKASR